MNVERILVMFIKSQNNNDSLSYMFLDRNAIYSNTHMNIKQNTH